ncbi:YibE/F family protein, partial [Candidatus Parcubacteria bacterium]|nr:YibE/F family protein [Candidatus Parcubacteria bacterium]
YEDIVVQSIDSNEDKQTLVFAQLNNELQDKIFKAEVIEILRERQTVLPDGTVAEQQDLLLRGLEKEFADREIEFKGIGEFDVIKKNIYQVGDKVLMVAVVDHEGNVQYYITDYVRTNSLWWLALVFVLSLFIVGGWKGLRSLIALIITFFVIIQYIIPSILAGNSPLFTVLIGSLMILLIIIYLTEGFRARSHIAVASIFLSLIITAALSWFFVSLTKLSGLASEEIYFLITIGEQVINFKGLLLAGIIIGALGVLDDVVISQVATVEQLAKANSYQSRGEIFKRAYKVGVSHISSMTNTLFLAYVGVSLPLLILFVSGQSAFTNWLQIINNEAIATEIVRTLAGSIGLILSVPIATAVAVWWFGKK